MTDQTDTIPAHHRTRAPSDSAERSSAVQPAARRTVARTIQESPTPIVQESGGDGISSPDRVRIAAVVLATRGAQRGPDRRADRVVDQIRVATTGRALEGEDPDVAHLAPPTRVDEAHRPDAIDHQLAQPRARCRGRARLVLVMEVSDPSVERLVEADRHAGRIRGTLERERRAQSDLRAAPRAHPHELVRRPIDPRPDVICRLFGEFGHRALRLTPVHTIESITGRPDRDADRSRHRPEGTRTAGASRRNQTAARRRRRQRSSRS